MLNQRKELNNSLNEVASLLPKIEHNETKLQPTQAGGLAQLGAAD